MAFFLRNYNQNLDIKISIDSDVTLSFMDRTIMEIELLITRTYLIGQLTSKPLNYSQRFPTSR